MTVPVRAALAAAVAAGVVLRLVQFFAWRSLWMDEAMLAVNVVERSWWGLFEPLEYNQGAPVLFLLLQKAVVTLAGVGDAALRVVPTLASCLSVLLFARVAVDWLGAGGPALLAVALMAACPALVSYAAEAKQYPVDVAASVALLASLGPVVRAAIADHGDPPRVGTAGPSESARGSTAGPRPWIAAALAGAVLPWCSHPAAFGLPGVGLVLACASLGRKGNPAAAGPVALLAIAASWVASLALLYVVSLRGLSSNAALLAHWESAFAPLGSPQLATWTFGAVSGLLGDLAGLPGGLAGMVLVALGLVGLARRRLDLALVLALPALLAFAASGLRLYPFGGRLLHFAVPFALLAAAAGAGCLASLAGVLAGRLAPRAATRLRVAALALVSAWLLAGPAAGALEAARSPRGREHLRPALEFLASRRQPGEALYVYYGAKPAYRFYAPLLGLGQGPKPGQEAAPFPDGGAVVAGRAHRGNPGTYRVEVAALASYPGAWVVLSHSCCPTDEWEAILDELDRRGRRVESHEENGAAVHHYRFGADGNAPAPGE